MPRKKPNGPPRRPRPRPRPRPTPTEALVPKGRPQYPKPFEMTDGQIERLADGLAARLLDRGLDTKIERQLARRGLMLEFLAPTMGDPDE
jgi:hypothetical protein